MFGLAAAAVGLLWLTLPPAERARLAELLSAERVGLMVVFGIVVAGALAAFVYRWRQATSVPALRAAESIRLALGANSDHRVALEGSPELRALAAAVNELADHAAALRRDVDESVRAARSDLEAERNRLAALMSELAQSVLVCNLEGRILLYNAAAQQLFGADGAALLGLGRSVFGLIDRNLILHGLEQVERALQRDAPAVARFVAATHSGGLLRAQLAPVLAPAASERAARKVTGYVLLLTDVTDAIEQDSRHVALVQTLAERTRAALASIRAAIENLVGYPDMEAPRRARFTAIIRDESVALTAHLDEARDALSAQVKDRWPLEDMRGEDLVTVARNRIERRLSLSTKVESVDESLWVRVDSFSVAQGLAYLASRLRDEFAVREVRFRLAPGPRHAHLDLIWRGAPLSPETAFAWENDPFTLGGEPSPLTWKQVVERHGGEAWYQRDLPAQTAYFRLLLPLAAGAARLAQQTVIPSRPEFYDFDLFRVSPRQAALDERMLAELAYTVFDTETTGLNPSQGDEIISIGATRIVNGRLLTQETFEQLVDPRRPLSAASIAIHGITAELLEGRPGIEQVLPRFHKFCEDTVLVAHNAAFDMRFLQMKESVARVTFDHPVLDTLLLSAVLHPHQDAHSLEAIAARLGVPIIGRHTALGDAIVTGEVFLRMLPLLAQAGIRTLGEARTAARETFYSRVSY